MSHKFYVFANVPAADLHVTLSHDSGWSGIAMPATDPQGRAGSLIEIPDSVPVGQGAQLNLDAEGMLPLQMRGVLVYPDTARAYLQCDDFFLTEAASEPPVPPPNPTPTSPLDIINGVYASGNYNLATKTGCGTFTEECCRQLAAAYGTPPWGHVAKSPGQNQFNAHAVDAVMSLYGEDDGIWDIITSSVSSSARPAFNRAGDCNPEIWRPPTPLPCQPALAVTRTATKESVRLVVAYTIQQLSQLLVLLSK